MCKRLIGVTFLVWVLLSSQGHAREIFRAAYWDSNFAAHWADPATVDEMRDYFAAAGYQIVNADELKTWMNARIADGKASVIVLCQDLVPETVAETMTATCTIRKYLDAGGKVLYYGDIPFYNQGKRGGTQTNWGNAGAPAVLGFDTSGAPRNSGNLVQITDQGLEWGLTEKWTSTRPAAANVAQAQELTVLAIDDAGNAAAWVKHFVQGDTSRGFVRLFDQNDNATLKPNFDDMRRVAEYGLQGNPYPRRPDPKNGAALAQTWTGVSWFPGDFAVSHDVYMGVNPDDVAAGTGGTLRMNLPRSSTSFFIGLGLPGDPYPGGLVPGTTYYWRIDEVNSADPNSPWKGPVWSFFVTPTTAYKPNPANGAKFVLTDTPLNWTAGLNAKLHYVYFGDKFDDVNNATQGGAAITTASYTPSVSLLKGKTYYWRVDEFDGAKTYKGEVWSFSVLPDVAVTDPNLIGSWTFDEGEGAVAVDWSGHNNNGKFNGDLEWVFGYSNNALDFDGSGDWLDCGTNPSLGFTDAVTITAWVKVRSRGATRKIGGNQNNSTGGYKMAVHSDNKVELEIRTAANTAVLNRAVPGGTDLQTGLWYHVAGVYSLQGGYLRTYVNGVLDRDMATTEAMGASAGSFKIGCEPYTTTAGNFSGVMDEVHLYNKALTQEQIQQIMRIDPLLAWAPKPAEDSSPDVEHATALTWTRGDKATQHDVYFGLDRTAVANAGASDATGIYRGRQGTTSYTPAEGLTWGGGPYYWRVDEVNNDGTVTKGRVWNFKVADYLVVDDIESYNDLPDTDAASNRIYTKWIDGYGTTTNGAFVGNLDVPLTERANVHGGVQAMPLSYDNNLKFSEATLTLTAGMDWTRQGVTNLSLWSRGLAANTAERMYVVLNGTAVVYNDDTTLTQRTAWTQWTIPLQQFAAQGVNLSNVTSITIGFGTRGNTTTAGGTGQMYFDDISLVRSAAP